MSAENPYHCAACGRETDKPIRHGNLGLQCPHCKSGRIRHENYPEQS